MTDLNTQILIDIREELRSTKATLGERIDNVSGRIDNMSTRVNERLDHVVEGLVRQRTELVEVQGRQRETNEALAGIGRDIRGLNSRLDNVLVGPMGTTVKEHESRLRRVEEHLGLAGPSK
jgi:hypothetical protein